MSKQPVNIHESSRRAPGMWRVPKNPDQVCIYRVPNRLREVNPQKYTPQLLLIGPLHHYLIAQARESREDITNTRLVGYLNMEEHKKLYLREFGKRSNGKGSEHIGKFRSTIKEEKETIEDSYSESTAWIPAHEFLEMILLDSVFILEFFLRSQESFLRSQESQQEKTGDPLIDQPRLKSTVCEDLILLENQLPYFILDKLFEPILQDFSLNINYRYTFRELSISTLLSKDNGKIKDSSKFQHFTDMVRCAYVDTLPDDILKEHNHEKSAKDIYNADKLYQGGIRFKVVEGDFSIYVKFDKGCLCIPRFFVHDSTESTLRNIIALEQFHYPCKAHVSNHIIFLDFLIDTEKDVDLLVQKGVVRNWVGDHASLADLVNKLCDGVLQCNSYYGSIADNVIDHYSDRFNQARASLKRVYFSNMWKGTGTIAATILLVMTFIQTIASIIQAKQK